MNGMNNSVETVNAAATAIVTAESRVQQVTSPSLDQRCMENPASSSSVLSYRDDQRRRWGGWLSIYWCFGSQRNGKRISHAVVIPETTVPGSALAAPENVPLSSTLAPPFVAPPPSPASFLQSEPSSAIHSPVGLFSLTTLSANSSSGTSSIFAIGPYAHETQLVSPPAFTTEPSTAPFTPPPESVHFTNPPSPEVPFAQLLMSSLDSNLRKGDCNEFYTYHLYPGSPIGHLISPSSLCSGNSSPFPDLEFHSSITNGFPSLPIAEPPKLLNADDLALRKAIPLQLRRGILVSDSQITAIKSIEGINNTQKPNPLLDRRLSFDLADENVTYCLEKEPASTATMESGSSPSGTKTDIGTPHQIDETESTSDIGETYYDFPDKLQSSASDRVEKEFKFDNAEGTPSDPTNVESDWWTNEKAIGKESGESKNWAFFPLQQPGVS